ncbi:unnamed protein product [Notodromas monacha]|uniref:F-box/LRR-repeat protein 15-like leucin rich repeat domain-containing protein n=1 Tax=Notodromas monacha TaxID=399045 RepID=A0A7R9BTK5_9CRUS|nr:unnamed protein product [Notodromas monacha]CAG0921504.1 unnamed protein product [Notodromas monacha]
MMRLTGALSNLTSLSLSGCSKISDEGIEVIAEHMRRLKCLDLSWCPRLTDAALEYIACDLGQLEELALDRCILVTDIGLGYLSTMVTITFLSLRWCPQIRDFGMQHICGMRNLRILFLAAPLESHCGPDIGLTAVWSLPNV